MKLRLIALAIVLLSATALGQNVQFQASTDTIKPVPPTKWWIRALGFTFPDGSKISSAGNLSDTSKYIEYPDTNSSIAKQWWVKDQVRDSLAEYVLRANGTLTGTTSAAAIVPSGTSGQMGWFTRTGTTISPATSTDNFDWAQNIRLSLPDTIYIAGGQECNIYFWNVAVATDFLNYRFVVTCDSGNTYEDNWRWTPDVSTSTIKSLTVSAYNVNNTQIATASTVVKVVPGGQFGTAKTLLMIGDSYTQGGQQTATILRNGGANITAIGTVTGTEKGTAYKHEGYGGQTWVWHYSDASSPFVFSGKFNINTYLTNNSFSNPDFITILLGTNDVAGTSDATIAATCHTIMGYVKSMTDSLLSQLPSVQIGVCYETPMPMLQDALSARTGGAWSNETAWQRRRCIQVYNDSLKAMLGVGGWHRNNRISLIPCSVNLDTKNNWSTSIIPVNARSSNLQLMQSGTVHPASSGYYQMADMIYGWLKTFVPTQGTYTAPTTNSVISNPVVTSFGLWTDSNSVGLVPTIPRTVFVPQVVTYDDSGSGGYDTYDRLGRSVWIGGSPLTGSRLGVRVGASPYAQSWYNRSSSNHIAGIDSLGRAAFGISPSAGTFMRVKNISLDVNALSISNTSGGTFIIDSTMRCYVTYDSTQGSWEFYRPIRGTYNLNYMNFAQKNVAGTKINVAQILTDVRTNTAGAENGRFSLNVMKSGTMTQFMQMDGVGCLYFGKNAIPDNTTSYEFQGFNTTKKLMAWYSSNGTRVADMDTLGSTALRMVEIGAGQNAVLYPFKVSKFNGDSVATVDTVGNAVLSGYTVTTDVRASDSVTAATGRFSGNLSAGELALDSTAYGSVYIEDTHPDTIMVGATGIFYTVGAVQAPNGYKWTSGGVLKNVTVQDSSMTIGVDGNFEVSWSVSVSSANVTNGKFNWYLYVNNVKQDKTGAKRLLSGTNDLGCIAVAPTVLALKKNDIIKLKVQSIDDSSCQLIHEYAILHVKKITD